MKTLHIQHKSWTLTGKKSDNGLRDLLHDHRFANRDVDPETRKLRRNAYDKFKAAGYMNILYKTNPKVHNDIYFTNGETIPASTYNRIVWRMSRRGRNAKAYNQSYFISETKKGNIILPLYLKNKLRLTKHETRKRAIKQWCVYCDTI